MTAAEPPGSPIPLTEGIPALPRVGLGVDVHPFADDDRPLRLACLTWPGERGLRGHSDGDVVAHAICDALLSAVGMGDVGSQYGVDDPRWAGASGNDLLGETIRRLGGQGWAVGNVSVQLVGERPRISDRRAEAEAAMAAALGAHVTLSATTTEGLGFAGRGEGLLAIATALVVRR